ncbi:hypothetical protein A4H97_01565 [Niastella yeongjuensis]|uniref:Apea-like HEPN domain-containing protein n=1 Tax=Niastella yeongjuensis TaxID=354355 RepID=A0A1V9EXB5_9BACT|nr:hypothetical protein [Niastella yeongjuensis]OQP50555.1 hypothetical protein A4H97_01565 [Niastella yeongjuensis]SEN29008.1 hypothetical protein SAMN05660816_00632 [Niastella yeongjuensis]
MIAYYKVNSQYTPAERFLAEKIIELVYYKTLDSHRVRLNNPKGILHEIKYVLRDWHANKIKHFDKTIRPVILETLQLLKNDTALVYGRVNKSYFHGLLGGCSDKNYLHLYHATNLVLEANKNYLERLFELIEAEINRINTIGSTPFDVSELFVLNTLVDYLGTELINYGFSKGFLYAELTHLFSDATANHFQDAFNNFKLLGRGEQEDFIVIFRLNKIAGKTKNIDLKSKLELAKEEKEKYVLINNKSTEFFAKGEDDSYYLKINLKGWDYLSVIEKAKKELFSTMDILHLGFPDNPFDFYKKCLVIGSQRGPYANVLPVSYIPDGYYKNNQDLYDFLQEKITRLSEKREIQRESLQKIISAFRHLRLGRDADELEQKFINYWIGLEYIFSNYDINDNTITRLKEYFIHAHSIAYIKRNLTEYCQDIRRLKLSKAIPDFGFSLQFLTEVSTFDYILHNYSISHPLLSFRAYSYKKFITDKSEIERLISKHRSNLEWHLTRCYRIRNEIVHDAAIHLNIESITGNLKYYLTFILNGLISYLDDMPVDVNMNGFVSIEDYFLLQEIRYNSLHKSGFKLDQLIEETSATEIFG